MAPFLPYAKCECDLHHLFGEIDSCMKRGLNRNRCIEKCLYKNNFLWKLIFQYVKSRHLSDICIEVFGSDFSLQFSLFSLEPFTSLSTLFPAVFLPELKARCHILFIHAFFTLHCIFEVLYLGWFKDVYINHCKNRM